MQAETNSPFTSIVGLGALETQHPVTRGSKWTGLIVGVVALLGAPACLLLSGLIFMEVYAEGGLPQVWDKFITVFWPVGGAVVAGLLGLWLLYTTWRDWTSVAAVFQQGLAFADRSGVQQFRWEDVDHILQRVVKQYRNGVYVGTTYLYTVKTLAGRELKFDNKFAEIAKLGEALQQKISSALFPRFVNALNTGQRAVFGPLAFDREQVYHGAKALKWSEVQVVRVVKGGISIYKTGAKSPWASAAVDAVPNFFIFYDLVGRLSKVE